MLSLRAGIVLGCSSWLLGCSSQLDLPTHEHVGTLSQAIRPLPSMTSQPPVFDANVEIDKLDSKAGFFRVHYQRSGRNAVPLEDRDRDGTPDYVNRVADDFD